MPSVLTELNRILASGQACVMARIVEHPDVTLIAGRMLVTETAALGGERLGEPLRAAIAEKSRPLIWGPGKKVETAWFANGDWSSRPGEGEGAVRVAFEHFRPDQTLVICGAGHVGRALAFAAVPLHYRIVIIDDRADFASRDRFPDSRIEVLAKDFEAALEQITITPSTNIVIVTRGHAEDERCLRAVIRSSAGYIGMIGSRRRVEAVYQRLERDGIPRELAKKVHAPIGLPIGARTPEEIAISILAEIIQVRNQ